MDFALSPELLALRDRARAVAADGVAAFGRRNDSWINGYSKEFARVMADEGWIGMGWPTEFGGQARPAIERLIVAEEMISAGAPVAAMWFADRQMGPSLIAYGTEQQRTAFLPGMLTGDDTWCIGMSEPDAGSDLASIATRAVRDGDHFVIDGQKIWTSFGHLADYCYLICRTNDSGPPHRGVSEIIVPMDLPGIEVRPITDMIANRHFCEIYFTGVRVPADHLVGVEGDAFRQTMVQLAHERGGIDRLVSNRALFVEACSRADRADPRVRQQIAALEAEFPGGPAVGVSGGFGSGPGRVQRGHQGVLHRTPAAGGLVRGGPVGTGRHAREPVDHRRAVRPLLHHRRRHLRGDAEHPGRPGARSAP